MTSAAKVSIIIAVLSISQLALAQSRHSSGGGHDDNRPMSNDEIAQRVARTKDFLDRTDTNHNGMIDPDEAGDGMAKGYLDRIFSRMGREPHYPEAVSEILRGYESYYRTRGSSTGSGSSTSGSSPAAMGWTSPPGMGFGSTAPSPSVGSPSLTSLGRPIVSSVPSSRLTVTPPFVQAMPSQPVVVPPAGALPPVASPITPSPPDTKPAPRKPARFLTARERLPKGLPDWFLEKDINGDGQVTMAEFTDNWTPEKVAEFARYDLNHDGIITAAECLKVERAKANSN